MKTRLFIAIAIGVLVSAGCEREQENAIVPTDTQQILGNWQLVEPASAFKTTLAIAIDKPSGGTISGIYSLKFTGDAAVNSYGTTVRLVNSATGTLDVESIVTTKKAGEPAAMQFEQTYYTNLKAVNQYELINDNKLRLRYEGGVLVYDKVN